MSNSHVNSDITKWTNKRGSKYSLNYVNTGKIYPHPMQWLMSRRPLRKRETKHCPV